MARPRLKQHIIHRQWCGICVHFCPKQVLALDESDNVVAAHPEDCICCRMCEYRCPDLAIEVETTDVKTTEEV